MPTKLHDRRESDMKTIDDAKALFDSIARSEIMIAKAKAQAEARIATIKDATAAKVAMIDPDIDAKRAALSDYVETHPEQFVKPRHVSTDFGKFGLQAAKRVEIFNEAAATEFVVDQKMLSCYETVHKLNRKGIQNAMEASVRIPGCKLLDGSIAHYTVAKALIDEAKGAPE